MNLVQAYLEALCDVGILRKPLDHTADDAGSGSSVGAGVVDEGEHVLLNTSQDGSGLILGDGSFFNKQVEEGQGGHSAGDGVSVGSVR
jgi:hypothetical protein